MDEDFHNVQGRLPEVDVATAKLGRDTRFTIENSVGQLAEVTYGELVRVRKQFATYLLGGAHRKDPLDPNLDPVIREMVLQFRAHSLNHCRLCSAIAPCHLGICAWGCGHVMMWPRE